MATFFYFCLLIKKRYEKENYWYYGRYAGRDFRNC